jgi:P-type Ca2+ transporter type 2C
LEERVINTNVFTRMFPEAKLRIINALKARGEIVAMTGDGVNDGPALKAAHIGISMGKKGSEIARQASSLILMEDDLSSMVDAVAIGRKIYTNLKKAIQYIISIHIPIILVVFLPLTLGWIYPSIFSPIHIIFLELIMGPTCSIIYENEPLEKNVMLQNPRPFTATFFNVRELTTSIIQGLVITAGVLFIYQYAAQTGSGEATIRTMVFLTLISSNIFLTLVNRSFYYSIFTTASYRNSLVQLIIVITVVITGMLLLIKPLVEFFEFQTLSFLEVVESMGVGFFSVIWFEGVKWKIRKRDSL